jgi:hypothetical protein
MQADQRMPIQYTRLDQVLLHHRTGIQQKVVTWGWPAAGEAFMWSGGLGQPSMQHLLCCCAGRMLLASTSACWLSA